MDEIQAAGLEKSAKKLGPGQAAPCSVPFEVVFGIPEEKPKLNPGFWLSTGLTAPGRGTTWFNGIVLPIGEHPDREKGRSCENVDHQVVTGGTRGSKGSP